MFTYPPKPWFDGQVHQVVTEDGHYITGVYDMSSNTWNLHHGTSGGHAGGLVMTPDVKTVNTPPTKPIPTGTRITYPNINTQQDANWALQKQIDDIRGLTTSVWIGNSLETPPLSQSGDIIYYLWYQTDNEVLLQYSVQQQAWIPIEGEGAASIAFSSIAPEFPTPFSVWFNVLSKETFVGFNGQWWNVSNQEAINSVNEALLQEIQDRIDGDDDLWIGANKPTEDGYKFWWDTLRLELLIEFNGQWWPVSIPPAQAELLRQEIDALYQDTATNRLNIAVTQQELDTKVLETKERIDVVEETADDAKAAADAATIAAGNAAQVNQDNTFSSSKTNTFEGNLVSDKQLTITAPSSTNTNPTFQIKGTSTTGTINSVVLNATQSGSRMRVTYKGPIDSDDEITTKKYVDNAVGPASHKWIFKPDTDKMDLNPGEFTGPRQPTYGNGTHYSYYFHLKSLTGEMEFYQDYNMYFPMNALWGAFHFLNGSKWRLKQYVPVRDIKMFNNDNYLEIYTHTDYPTGGEIIAGFDAGTEYYFAIGGMI